MKLFSGFFRQTRPRQVLPWSLAISFNDRIVSAKDFAKQSGDHTRITQPFASLVVERTRRLTPKRGMRAFGARSISI
jgi:hypothetical protein